MRHFDRNGEQVSRADIIRHAISAAAVAAPRIALYPISARTPKSEETSGAKRKKGGKHATVSDKSVTVVCHLRELHWLANGKPFEKGEETVQLVYKAPVDDILTDEAMSTLATTDILSDNPSDVPETGEDPDGDGDDGDDDDDDDAAFAAAADAIDPSASKKKRTIGRFKRADP